MLFPSTTYTSYQTPIGATWLNAVNSVASGPFVFRNKLINGDFSIWQRANTQSTTGYGSVDRWAVQATGSSQVITRRNFTPGSSNSTEYLESVVTSSAGATNFAALVQSIENVTMLQNTTVTVSFTAWVSSGTKEIGLDLYQYFGAGGSPSATVSGIGSQKFTLTTTPTRFVSTPIVIPAITGKTLGTTANSSATTCRLWFDAGSSYTTLSGGISQQSGTFYLSDVQLETGSYATAFERTPYSTQFERCQRYYETRSFFDTSYGGTGDVLARDIPFVVAKRISPTITLSNSPGYANSSTQTAVFPTSDRFIMRYTVTSAGSATLNTSWVADAEL